MCGCYLTVLVCGLFRREVQCTYANAKTNKIQCYWKGKARRLETHLAECCARPTAPRQGPDGVDWGPLICGLF